MHNAVADTTPFDDLGRYVRIARIGELVLSPGGDRLVTAVAQLDEDGGRHVSSLWAVDPTGKGPARRLTRSTEGEASPVFAPDGSLLFISKRPRPGGKESDPAGVWRLPPEGGEPWPVATHPGGITDVRVASHASVVVFAAMVAPGRRGDDEESWHHERRTRKISAVLHENLPVRHWDHELGPEEVHYFAGVLPGLDADPSAGGGPATIVGVRDLTPDAGRSLHDATPVPTSDGADVVTAWEVQMSGGRVRDEVVRIDVASGARTVLASHPDGAWSYYAPAVSGRDGRVACLGESRATWSTPPTVGVFLVDRPGGEPRRLPLDEGLWPAQIAWSADGRSVIVVGDLGGRRPVHRVDIDTGESTPLATEGAWSAPAPAPDGSLYALRSGIDRPPAPARLRPPGQSANGMPPPEALVAPGRVDLPGRVEELHGRADDGTALRAWLVLPTGASPDQPAPLLLWVHGGPLSSWNDWSWRWSPWLMAARGWAVLLPDPALSTGYGPGLVERGYGQWGGAPYRDVLAMTDLAGARADIDQDRTAAMGGSYGGYMANWIAGHTTRFAAIVSHASIWSVEQFQRTTDLPSAWSDEWGRPGERPDFYRAWSPDTYIDDISTPMLVIHGKDDYRCPVSESVRLWTDLVEHGVAARYLSFPDENHWVLKPGNTATWYETVFAFLDHHVLGLPWVRPPLV